MFYDNELFYPESSTPDKPTITSMREIQERKKCYELHLALGEREEDIEEKCARLVLKKSPIAASRSTHNAVPRGSCDFDDKASCGLRRSNSRISISNNGIDQPLVSSPTRALSIQEIWEQSRIQRRNSIIQGHHATTSPSTALAR